MAVSVDNDTAPSVPIGTGATGTRVESDSMGSVEVPAEHYWGAQTQRSLIHFSIGDDHMPKGVYHAYGYVKKAAALVNEAAGRPLLSYNYLYQLRRGTKAEPGHTRLAAIAGVRNMISFDGAQITVGGQQVNAIGVNPATFRSWVPLQTASDQPFWTALASGEFAAATNARKSLGLSAGASYQLTGASTQLVRFGGAASLGIEGVDLLRYNEDGLVAELVVMMRPLSALHAMRDAMGEKLAALAEQSG